MPVIKLCPKLILEGTGLTGKTDLALVLNESSRITGVSKYRYHSPIVSAELNGLAAIRITHSGTFKGPVPPIAIPEGPS